MAATTIIFVEKAAHCSICCPMKRPKPDPRVPHDTERDKENSHNSRLCQVHLPTIGTTWGICESERGLLYTKSQEIHNYIALRGEHGTWLLRDKAYVLIKGSICCELSGRVHATSLPLMPGVEPREDEEDRQLQWHWGVGDSL